MIGWAKPNSHHRQALEGTQSHLYQLFLSLSDPFRPPMYSFFFFSVPSIRNFLSACFNSQELLLGFSYRALQNFPQSFPRLIACEQCFCDPSGHTLALAIFSTQVSMAYVYLQGMMGKNFQGILSFRSAPRLREAVCKQKGTCVRTGSSDSMESFILRNVDESGSLLWNQNSAPRRWWRMSPLCPHILKAHVGSSLNLSQKWVWGNLKELGVFIHQPRQPGQ